MTDERQHTMVASTLPPVPSAQVF